MLELRLTDLELQRLLAPALKKRLRREGFRFGSSETPVDGYNTVMLPVRLDLAESVSISRDADGIWTIQQADLAVERRFFESMLDHSAAIDARAHPPSPHGEDE